MKLPPPEIPATPPPPAPALIRKKEVQRRTGLCHATLYGAIKGKRFPAPVKISDRCSAWVAREVDDWIAARIATRDKLEPSA
jgi:prophage regulatory protein